MADIAGGLSLEGGGSRTIHCLICELLCRNKNRTFASVVSRSGDYFRVHFKLGSHSSVQSLTLVAFGRDCYKTLY